MARRVRIGVIGLGRYWRRLLPHLRQILKRVEIHALYDQVPARCQQEAHRLGCSAAVGPVDLLERDEIEALLWLDQQWFGTWPLEVACRVGKPVCCVHSLSAHDLTPALIEQLRQARVFVFQGSHALAQKLAEPLHQALEPLGAPQLVRIERTLTHRAELSSRALPFLLSLGASLFPIPPQTVWAEQGAGLATLVLRFSAGQLLQVVLAPASGKTGSLSGVPSGWRIQAQTEQGTVALHGSRDLRWYDASGQHQRLLPRLVPEVALVAQFTRVIRQGEEAQAAFEEALLPLRWQQAALTSQREGQRITLAPG
jgi:hypothetical protein